MVRQGGVICLSVPIIGKPIPTCKWTKDGRDISHRAMIATYDDVTELVIKEAHKDDSGTYDLVLENKCGRKAVYIKVCHCTKMSKVEIVKKSFKRVKLDILHLLTHRSRSSAALIVPRVRLNLMTFKPDQFVLAGDPLQMTVALIFLVTLWKGEKYPRQPGVP